MKKSKFLFSSLKRNSLSRLFKRKNNGSEKKFEAMVGKNSWSFISYSTPNESMKREEKFNKKVKEIMDYIFYNSNYGFNSDDVINKESVLNTYYIRTDKSFIAAFDEGFEKCTKERDEAFACFVMITLMERLKQPCPNEAQHIKEQISNCPTGKEILTKWDEALTNILQIPDALDNERARKLLEKAQDTGYLDENFQPTDKMKMGTGRLNLTKVAIFAQTLGHQLGLNLLYAPFEELWHVQKLERAASRHNREKKVRDFRNELYKTL